MDPSDPVNYKLTFILLLGSYDPDTRQLLDVIKGRIARRYAGEGVYSLLLDEVEIFNSKDYFVLVEKWSEEEASAHIFSHDGKPEESYRLKLTEGTSIDDAVRDLLRNEFGVKDLTRLPVLKKLDVLVQLSKSIIAVRDKEETRGGEIAELVYCIMKGFSDKVCLFKKEGFKLSSMLMEFLDQLKVTVRAYRDRNDLVDEVLRFLSYRLK